jgi:polyphosphate kinase
MKEVQKRDILLTYPYDAFYPFLKLIEEAASDPDVLSIKITIYRLARRAKLIDYLTLAAENGKDVTVVIELKARFDEQNNIDFSEILELAGCKVIYGVEKLKIHSKLCVITKQEKGQLKYVTQIGTGNFNETTVKLYTDFGLITSHEGIALDALKVFQSISLNAYKESFDHLLVAPKHFKQTLLDLIEKEASKGQDGYMFLKVNSITDMDIIHALVDASQKGVTIEMIVRGICCILPGVKGYTENISIRSIVGRFLEHSRLYVFGYDLEAMYIGSADFMTRNTERRIEVASPIYSKEIKMYIASYMDVLKSDDVISREINSEGDHKMLTSLNVPFNSQEYMLQYYLDMFPKKKSFFEKIFKNKKVA